MIEANEGTGFVTRVVYSPVIPIDIEEYTYTGNNGESIGTEEEVTTFNNVIDRAEHIDQIENTLVLADVKGKQINFCKLQNYASKIQADLIFKEVLLNVIDAEGNQKRGTALHEGIGYMPGEIYSFGIVYVFKDGTVSPVFHIPGRNPGYASQMDLNNTLENTYYTAEDCPNEDYWGVDSEGDTLKDNNVRHHRFPLRSAVNEPLIVKTSGVISTNVNRLYINVSGTIGGAYTEETILLEVVYTVNGITSSYQTTILVASYNPALGLELLVTTTTGTLVFVSATEIQSNGTPVITPSGLVYTDSVVVETLDVENGLWKTNIFGIKFSNVELPDASSFSGEEIIGYYIVRNDRKETEKTIVDTGVITGLAEEPYYVAHGMLMPQRDVSKMKKDIFAIIHPEHRFKNAEYRM